MVKKLRSRWLAVTLATLAVVVVRADVKALASGLVMPDCTSLTASQCLGAVRDTGYTGNLELIAYNAAGATNDGVTFGGGGVNVDGTVSTAPGTDLSGLDNVEIGYLDASLKTGSKIDASAGAGESGCSAAGAGGGWSCAAVWASPAGATVAFYSHALFDIGAELDALSSELGVNVPTVLEILGAFIGLWLLIGQIRITRTI